MRFQGGIAGFLRLPAPRMEFRTTGWARHAMSERCEKCNACSTVHVSEKHDGSFMTRHFCETHAREYFHAPHIAQSQTTREETTKSFDVTPLVTMLLLTPGAVAFRSDVALPILVRSLKHQDAG